MSVKFSELFYAANLLSLLRILLVPVIGYFLRQNTPQATGISLALLVVAGITDGLDGYVARKFHQVSQTGLILDPLADKLLAGGLVILLVLMREMPVWLAAVIVGRDLLIVGGGLLLLRGKKIVVPSNLTGKYAFAAIAVLLGSFIIRFDFGITLLTPIVVGLSGWSLVNYFRLFLRVKKGNPIIPFADRPIYRALRILVTTGISVLFLYHLFRFFSLS